MTDHPVSDLIAISEAAGPYYPEHERMKAIKPQADVLGAFVDWLESQDMWICDRHRREYWPINGGYNALFAKYLGIDLKLIDAEKEQMLEYIRAGHRARDASASAEGAPDA